MANLAQHAANIDLEFAKHALAVAEFNAHKAAALCHVEFSLRQYDFNMALGDYLKDLNANDSAFGSSLEITPATIKVELWSNRSLDVIVSEIRGKYLTGIDISEEERLRLNASYERSIRDSAYI